MQAVATRAKDSTLRPGETIVETWGQTVFLIKGQDRHGRLAYSLRMVIGELTPWRFGPYADKRTAMEQMRILQGLLEQYTCDAPSEMCGDYAVNEDW